jgi:periplasmic protein TonB
MFETLEVRPRSIARRFGTFAASLVIHVAGISALVLIPLMWLNILPDVDVLTFLLAAPPLPPRELPPTPPVQVERNAGKQQIVIEGKEWEPKRIPDGIIPEAPPEEGIIFGPGTGTSGSPFGTGLPGNLRPEFVPTPAAPAPPPVKPPAPKVVPPLPVGGNVLESHLIRRVEPVYPELARRARVSGVVTLEVNVNEEGDVASVRVVRGQVLLDEAAVAAVRQWKYSPTLLNGEPVPVLALVTVVFTLR